ncbi:SDR family oxidoreductase [Cupriavidus pinatubonensis]|uniref:UDP-glucuronic acid decarboxylase family protein n=1 Tax=Cupriavidus pinatubonensis TaxID=248026 RepID=UPI001C72F476|nr:UDP-glucuronic acid decarboxylase family protein [Cupriavidus pinatubonensis]QYY28552.1 SDR family oxidoreductase [Cupriavidus pinatubonensis]
MREADRKRVLVTGGAGFLGSHLCERLVELGHDVLCVDNFYTGSKENISHLLPLYNFELLRHDVTFPLYVEVDQIYNLACPASPVHYQSDPVQTTKTSVHGAINMLGLAKRVKARILQASTSEVYGDPDNHPQRESYWGHVNPVGRRACYDEGKRCAETLFMDYHRQHGVDVRIARIFNTYGPRMHPADGRVVSNFISQALDGEPLTLYGDGSQTRSFCFVDDLVDGLMRLMESDAAATPVNLGNPCECTMHAIANEILQATGSASAIETRPLPEDDPRQRCPDITLARTLLQWNPATTLSEGLRLTVAYFVSRRAERARRLKAANRAVPLAKSAEASRQAPQPSPASDVS